MHIVFAALILLLTSTVARVQDETLMEAARAYVDHPVQQKLMSDMVSPEGVMAQLGVFDGSLPEDVMARMAEIMSEEMTTIMPALREAMITSMAQTFSMAEIQALNEFYASDVGASAMEKMTPFMQATSAQIAPAYQEMMSNLARRIKEEFPRE